MAKFIIFLNKLLNLYIYFIIGACVLSWIPNINPNYPLFNFIFKTAGFYIIPPFLGISFSPALVMIVCVLIMMGLKKIYYKYYATQNPEIIILTKDQFDRIKLQEENKVGNNDDI